MRTSRLAPLGAAAAALWIAGCATISGAPVNPADTQARDELEARAATRPTRILQTDGTIISPSALQVRDTELSWTDDRTEGVLPISEVSSIRVRKSSLAAGAGGGFLVGFGVGAAAGAILRLTDSGGELNPGAAATLWILGAMGTVGGTLGAGFGAAGAATWIDYPIVPAEPDGGP